mmetsp:Transcript_53454/g.173928  ORF Transcript_53454/g.173928 Transcript_53454/m.173928 type:complete len:201 (+) Transcript_53454:427-1029(+)
MNCKLRAFLSFKALSMTCFWGSSIRTARSARSMVLVKADKLSVRSARMSIASVSSFVTRCLTNLVAVLDSVFLIRNMASMNSSRSISPLLSTSTIWNNCLKSPLSMSMTRNQFLNSRTFLAPSSNSSKLREPLPSSSIFWKMLASVDFSSTSLLAIVSARLATSFSRASAKLSTMTATMRFSTPKTSVMRAPIKTMAVSG